MRFLHTADWHLGMTRRFLAPEAQARFAADRLQAVRHMAQLAADEGCAFVVACGDLFDSNHVDRQVVARALDALGSFEVPVYLLPGNHDPLDAASVYRSDLFIQRRPSQVTVIADAQPIAVAPGMELVGAPWPTRRPGRDLAADALGGLSARPGIVRVLAAHGAVDALAPDAGDPALIRVDALRHALFAGTVGYVALGDRHSAGEVDGDPRIRYPGTPVATAHDEVNAGTALVVDVDASGASVTEHRVGRWGFRRIAARLSGSDDVERLDAELDAVPDKSCAVVRLALVGALSVAEDARLQQVLDHHRDVLAGLTLSEGRSDLAVFADEQSLADLGLVGYAHDAATEIAAMAEEAGPEQQAARDALRLLNRLARPS
jgi:DNA repair exonuclease SbcCD nuclease subunit